MDSIIYDVQSLFEVALGQLGDRVQMVLSEAGVSSELRRSVEAEFASGTHTHIFAGLTTQSQQMAYFKKNFQFVVRSMCNYVMYIHIQEVYKYPLVKHLLFHTETCQGCVGNASKGQRFRC